MIFAVNISLDSLDSVLKELGNNGVGAIEARGEFFVECSKQKAIDLKTALAKQSINLWSVHAPSGVHHDLSSLDEAERQFTLEAYKRQISLAASAGAKVVVVHPSTRLGGRRKASAVDMLLMSLAELTRAAEEEGVSIGLENMLPGYLGDDPDELLGYLSRVNSSRLGICFDTGHAHIGRGVMASLDRLKEKIVTFHLQDNDGTRDMHLQPGYGTIPWNEFFPALESLQFSGPLVIDADCWAAADLSVELEEMALLSRHARSLRPLRLRERVSSH